MLRRLPRSVLRFVTGPARDRADECGGGNLLGRAASERQCRTAERQRQEWRACCRHVTHHSSTAGGKTVDTAAARTVTIDGDALPPPHAGFLPRFPALFSRWTSRGAQARVQMG